MYRNDVNKLINKCKNDYYKAKIENYKYKMEKVQKVINEAINQIINKGQDFLKQEIRIKNSNYNKDLENYCKLYFTNIGINMVSKLNKTTNEFKMSYHSLSSMFLKTSCKNEIIRHIFSLKIIVFQFH